MDGALLQRGRHRTSRRRTRASEEDGRSGLGHAAELGAWLGVRPAETMLGLIKRPNDGGELRLFWSLMRLASDALTRYAATWGFSPRRHAPRLARGDTQGYN